jgi:sarcosine oxidase
VDSIDVVVIGGGAMGTAAAYELGRRGVAATLLEQFAIGHERGSSRGPTRVFRHAYAQLDYVRLAQAALEGWRELEDAAGEMLLRLTGALDIGPHAEECALALEAAGIAHQRLRPSEAKERFPAVSFAASDEVLYHPDAGVCRAQRALAVLARLAGDSGVDVVEGARVEAIESDSDGVTVHVDGSQLRARAAVVTAGAWSGKVLATCGLEIPLVAASTHVAYYGPGTDGGDEVPVLIDRSLQRRDRYYYVVPSEAPGNRFVKVGEYWPEQIAVDPDQRTLEVDQAVIASHSAYVGRRLPALKPAPVASESCMYELTPSEDFIIDRVGSTVVGAGFSGHGFKFVPIVGRMLADLATGALNSAPATRFTLLAHGV